MDKSKNEVWALLKPAIGVWLVDRPTGRDVADMRPEGVVPWVPRLTPICGLAAHLVAKTHSASSLLGCTMDFPGIYVVYGDCQSLYKSLIKPAQILETINKSKKHATSPLDPITPLTSFT